jgi:hypothetical protein
VFGSTTTGQGVTGTASSTGVGVYGAAGTGSGSYGVYAINSSNGTALYATTSGASPASSNGVYGNNTGYGAGLQGVSQYGYGVYGYSTTGEAGYFNAQGFSGSGSAGVEGDSTYNNGVYGLSKASSASGVYGLNTATGIGVAGRVSPPGPGNAIYGDNNTTNGWAGYFLGRLYVSNGLQVNGTCVSGNCSSDERLKTNIKPLTASLDAVAALRPVTFEWKNPGAADRPAGTQTGFIAQDVEKVEPSWIHTDDNGFKMINRDALPMLLVDSIKTLKAQNDELRDRVAMLEASRRPVSQVGLMGGFGLLVVGGAFAATRRRKAES